MTPRKDGIDFIARSNAARDIFAAPPGICTRSLADETLAAENGLNSGATFPANRRHLYDVAIGINCHHRDDPAFGKEDMIERTVRVQKYLLALAANKFKVLHKYLEMARRHGKQKPIAGRI